MIGAFLLLCQTIMQCHSLYSPSVFLFQTALFIISFSIHTCAVKAIQLWGDCFIAVGHMSLLLLLRKAGSWGNSAHCFLEALWSLEGIRPCCRNRLLKAKAGMCLWTKSHSDSCGISFIASTILYTKRVILSFLLQSCGLDSFQARECIFFPQQLAVTCWLKQNL